MTCTTPLPERLDPPDTASECAICHRVTEDGRDLDLCDEAVEALRKARKLHKTVAVRIGKQFVCESCLDDLHDAQERHRAEAFDTISDALDLDEYEHPALRARKMVQRIQSTPAPVVGGVPVLPPLDPPTGIRTQDDPVWGMSGDLEAIFKMSGNPLLSAMHHGIWQGYDVARSRLPAIKPGEVVVAIPDPTGIVVDLPERYRERGIELVRNAIQWAREHARIVPRAQATTTKKETPC